MTAQLNHTIIWCKDKRISSAFIADILGLPAPRPFLHFIVVELANSVSIDFMDKEGPVSPQPYGAEDDL
jgi:hypothetical protein